MCVDNKIACTVGRTYIVCVDVETGRIVHSKYLLKNGIQDILPIKCGNSYSIFYTSPNYLGVLSIDRSRVEDSVFLTYSDILSFIDEKQVVSINIRGAVADNNTVYLYLDIFGDSSKIDTVKLQIKCTKYGYPKFEGISYATGLTSCCGLTSKQISKIIQEYINNNYETEDYTVNDAILRYARKYGRYYIAVYEVSVTHLTHLGEFEVDTTALFFFKHGTPKLIGLDVIMNEQDEKLITTVNTHPHNYNVHLLKLRYVGDDIITVLSGSLYSTENITAVWCDQYHKLYISPDDPEYMPEEFMIASKKYVNC